MTAHELHGWVVLSAIASAFLLDDDLGERAGVVLKHNLPQVRGGGIYLHGCALEAHTGHRDDPSRCLSTENLPSMSLDTAI